MNKRVCVIVSTKIDELIKEKQRDVEFLIFKSLHELSTYIETTPIRADKIFITNEVMIPINTSISFFLDMQGPFFVYDELNYITGKNGDDINSFEYIIQQNKIKNWRIIKGSLTREFLFDVINGTLKLDNVEPTRKAIYRMKKPDYVREKLIEQKALNNKYISEEEELSGIEEEPRTYQLPFEVEDNCKIINISGLQTIERTLFSFILGQYCSFNGKTIIVEKDFKYHRLLDIALKSEVDFLEIDLNEIYFNIEEVIRQIDLTEKNLILFTTKNRKEFNFDFIVNVLYSNLSDKISNMIVERELSEIPISNEYITVLPNNTSDIIKTLDNMPDNWSKFVCISINNLNSYNIDNGTIVSKIVQDVLQIKESFFIQILNIRNLKLKEDAHELRMYT